MKRVGYIYAVELHGFVKIGASRFPDKRVKTLAAMNGCKSPEYFVSELVESHLSIENSIHKHLSSRKIFSETFMIKMSEAIEVINQFCEAVTDKRIAEIEADELLTSEKIHKAMSQILKQPKELVSANDDLLKSCINECNEWLDSFGDEKDAVEFMRSLSCPIAVLSVSNHIKAKAIDALMCALNGDDSKLLKLGFTK